MQKLLEVRGWGLFLAHATLWPEWAFPLGHVLPHVPLLGRWIASGGLFPSRLDSGGLFRSGRDWVTSFAFAACSNAL